MNSENRYIEENKDIEGMECDADDGKYLQNENTPWRESSGNPKYIQHYNFCVILINFFVYDSQDASSR